MNENEQGGYKVPPRLQNTEGPKNCGSKKPEDYFDPQQVHVYSIPKKKAVKIEPSRRGLISLSLAILGSLLSLTLVALIEEFYGFLQEINPALSLNVVALVLLAATILCLAISTALATTAIHKRRGKYFGIAALAINASNIIASTPAILLLTQMLHLL